MSAKSSGPGATAAEPGPSAALSRHPHQKTQCQQRPKSQRQQRHQQRFHQRHQQRLHGLQPRSSHQLGAGAHPWKHYRLWLGLLFLLVALWAHNLRSFKCPEMNTTSPGPLATASETKTRNSPNTTAPIDASQQLVFSATNAWSI